jgi:hypothetical protein
VNNFKDEFRPLAIALPPGRGISFAKKINRLISDLKKDLPKAFEHEAYLKKLSGIKARIAVRQNTVFHKIERFAAERSLHIDSSQKDPGDADRRRQDSSPTTIKTPRRPEGADR